METGAAQQVILKLWEAGRGDGCGSSAERWAGGRPTGCGTELSCQKPSLRWNLFNICVSLSLSRSAEQPFKYSAGERSRAEHDFMKASLITTRYETFSF